MHTLSQDDFRPDFFVKYSYSLKSRLTKHVSRLLAAYFPKILSIFANSSSAKSKLSKAFKLSSSWLTREAPIRTLAIVGWRKFQAKAISAKV